MQKAKRKKGRRKIIQNGLEKKRKAGTEFPNWKNKGKKREKKKGKFETKKGKKQKREAGTEFPGKRKEKEKEKEKRNRCHFPRYCSFYFFIEVFIEVFNFLLKFLLKPIVVFDCSFSFVFYVIKLLCY